MHNVHPDIMLLLMNQRAAEAREAAQRIRIARTTRRLARARREPAEDSRAFAVPEIPDYVDAMFGESVTGTDDKSECRER